MLDDLNSKNADRLRYSIAIFLSIGVLLIWTYLQPPPQQPRPSPPTDPVSVPESDPTPRLTETSSESPVVPALPPDFPFEEEVIFLENDSLRVGINTLGGVVTESIIRFQATEKSRKMVSPDLEEIRLDGFETGNLFLEKPPAVFPKKISYRVVSRSEKELILEGGLQTTEGVIMVNKRFTLGHYRIKITLDFPGQGNFNYYLVNGAGLSHPPDKNSFYNIVNLAYNIEDSISTPLSQGITGFFSSPPEIEWQSAPFDWVSVDDRFYARVLKPLGSVEQGFFMNRTWGDQTYHISGIAANYQGSAQEYEFFYLPKSRNLLDSFYDQEKEYFFNLFHQFGFMRIISSIMYWVIESINGLIKNYGWSILIMTFLLKLVVFPLQQKSMNSMQRMQELSPKIKAIRENFKSKPQKMNQELMALYKKEGVNPLGGCLPMLIPLPVFIALYSLFNNMVEIQGSAFLWIEDLSLPDTLFRWGFDLPLLGSEFHLLPVIVMVSSLLQSYFTPQAPTTPENQLQMKMMKYMMPFFFFFISWNMSSALILYWTAQNIFTIGQTFLIKKSKKKL